MLTMIHASKDEPLLWLDRTSIVNGKSWIVGSGPLPAPVLVVGDYVREDDVALGTPFPGPSGKDLRNRLKRAGINIEDCRLTYAVRYNTGGKQPKQSDIGLCIPILAEEITRCAPKLIICLGACAVKAVLGHSAVFTQYRGSITPHPKLPDTNVFVSYNPAAIGTRPEIVPECEADWNALARFMLPELREDNNVRSYVFGTAEDVECMCRELSNHDRFPLLVLDCEWEGSHHQDPTGYLRTIQLGFADNEVAIVALDLIPDCERWRAMAALKQLLEEPGTRLCGHHLRADGKWLLSRGIDIRDTTVYDTMVAEHTINSTGPFGLTDMTLRYTGMGKYDQDLVQWKSGHADLCRKGYGAVPARILYPYAAADVEAPRRIMKKQAENLSFFLKPRGEYPSLWDVDLDASKTLYELENVGLLVDKDRLSELTRVYQSCRNELEAKVVQLAAAVGLPDYNFRSVFATRRLLFDCLGLTPINATDHTPWDRVIMENDDEIDDVFPATDKNTLAILADAPGTHPVVGALRDLRRVDYVCSLWLAEPEIAAKYDYESSGGGLLARMWPDGRLHANFSQLKETARFGSSRPNVQNFLKRAEGELRRIVTPKFIDPVFGPGAALPSLRSIVVPTPGYVLMEADWKQAEMFVLAALSGDDAMWAALTTPGLDLHDNTAISSFGIKIKDINGNPVPESLLLEMARRDFDKYGTTEKHEFEAFQNSLIYVDPRGNSLSRKAFKDGLRVSAKSINFGIPYGRGAKAIAIQVKAETGATTPMDELADELQIMMSKWKSELYPSAWKYMEECASAVTNPGYLINVWGRRREFPWPPVRDPAIVSKLGREAQNLPIQSTVADTCLITLWMMKRYRAQHGLGFRIINQIHDAIVVEAPESEIDATRQMFKDTMGNINIPVPGRAPLRLDIDIEVMTRWGEKQKKK